MSKSINQNMPENFFRNKKNCRHEIAMSVENTDTVHTGPAGGISECTLQDYTEEIWSH